MYDSTESATQGAPGKAPWLLLIHRIAPKPDYLRVKIQRRLRRIGARALKNSVYVLPNDDETLEDFQWLAQEIVADGGFAQICEASFIGADTNAEIATMFGTRELPASFQGLTWITRRGVKIDRIASAWLIRRFVDPEATFRFLDPRAKHVSRSAEQTFDMVEADFGHVAGGCTFEHLAGAFEPDDDALRAIGEIVHDIDLKDNKFQRPETAGIARLIRGIVETETDDLARIERGAAIFDELYASLR